MLASCEMALVLGHEVIAEDIRLLHVKWADQTGANTPHAGQFFTLRAWSASEAPFLSRPISVHSWNEEEHIVSFLYQVKGAGTEKLAALKVGDTLQVTGPMGNGFDVPTLAKAYQKIALVGGGIGTAPLYQLAKELHTAGVTPDVFFGFHDMPYRMERFRHIAGKVKVSTDNGCAGVAGLVTQLYNPADYDLVLVCGPTVMMKAVSKACAEVGVDCLVSLECKMACGIGACLGCTCKTTKEEARSICKNGPVFDAKEVYPW